MGTFCTHSSHLENVFISVLHRPRVCVCHPKFNTFIIRLHKRMIAL